MNIVSWNVNGVRACLKKGLLSTLKDLKPDVLCLQEVKCTEDKIPAELLELEDYNVDWYAAERPGYSGTATFIRRNLKVKSVERGIGHSTDNEGRVLIHDLGDFLIYNVYHPNGTSGPERLKVKMSFYECILKHWELKRKAGHELVLGGDVNTAHRPIDLARPKENEETSGFLPEERAWMDTVFAKGYIDTFRKINGDVPDEYSWWSFRSGSRRRNVGWRIDYWLLTPGLEKRLKGAFIRQDIEGSDHAPVGIELR